MNLIETVRQTIEAILLPHQLACYHINKNENDVATDEYVTFSRIADDSAVYGDGRKLLEAFKFEITYVYSDQSRGTYASEVLKEIEEAFALLEDCRISRKQSDAFYKETGLFEVSIEITFTKINL